MPSNGLIATEFIHVRPDAKLEIGMLYNSLYVPSVRFKLDTLYFVPFLST